MTSRLDLEYDGSGFYGWARQAGQRTVQAEVEAALSRILQREIPVTVAGRTDRGVHALAQVVSYEGPVVSAHALNALLPPDVAVHACAPAPDGWSARFDARSRSYAYRVLDRRERSALEHGRSLWWSHGLDHDLLRSCAALLAGEHDFTAFTPSQTLHQRFRRTVLAASWDVDGDLLLARWVEDGDTLSFEIEADSFMRHMNRVLVGTMLQVAQGRRTLEEFAVLLDGAHRRDAGPTAPPHGLYLTGVRYVRA